MAKRRPQYLVDSQGRKTAVLLGVKDYMAMLEKMEELEDTLALDEARRTDNGFRAYTDLREELRKEGSL